MCARFAIDWGVRVVSLAFDALVGGMEGSSVLWDSG